MNDNPQSVYPIKGESKQEVENDPKASVRVDQFDLTTFIFYQQTGLA